MRRQRTFGDKLAFVFTMAMAMGFGVVLIGAVVSKNLDHAIAAVISVILVLPIWAIMAWHFFHPPFAVGFCPKCGYDVRINPEINPKAIHHQCPECGTVTPNWRDDDE